MLVSPETRPFNRKACQTFEVYFTIGSKRGYHGASFGIEELKEEIGLYQASIPEGVACSVRVVKSEVIFQQYQEKCFDVKAINYPRFPKDEGEIMAFMDGLARYCMEVFEQERVTIIGKNITMMLERYGADQSRVHP